MLLIDGRCCLRFVFHDEQIYPFTSTATSAIKLQSSGRNSQLEVIAPNRNDDKQNHDLFRIIVPQL